MFEEVGGGMDKQKKRRMIFLAVGVVGILIYLVWRNAVNNAAGVSAQAQNMTVDPASVAAPTITDMGGYPDISGNGTGLNQTLATYLAVADQNTAVQMAGMNTALQNLQQQVTALNTAQTVAATNTPVPTTPAPPATTSHPDPHAITLIHYGTYKTPRGGWNPNSVVDNLKQAGAVATMAARTQYAKQAGIVNYRGTAAQNVQLLKTLKAQGK